MSGWLELRLRVAADASADLEHMLEQAGALAITQGEGDVAVFAEPGVASAAVWGELSISALFDDGIDVALIEAAIVNLLGAAAAMTWVAVPDQPWHQVWKQDWAPQSYVGGLCVCPSWCEPPASAQYVIRLDPGGAFGTGTHETTALCLDWLGNAPSLAGRRVIDYGCGSGILAIAAAKLGASAVRAVDIDDDALAVARDNAALNHCAGQIEVSRPDALPPAAADVLLANILLEPLLALAPRFAALLVADGALVLSGLLATQLAPVQETYAAHFDLMAPVLRGDWAMLAGRRRRAC